MKLSIKKSEHVAWKDWFAWHPVLVRDYNYSTNQTDITLVWLETILRMKTNTCVFYKFP